jgi:hypothetical protein
MFHSVVSSFWGIVKVTCSCCWQCFVYSSSYQQYLVYSSLDFWSHYNSSVGSVRFLVSQNQLQMVELLVLGLLSSTRLWGAGLKEFCYIQIIIPLISLAVSYFFQLECKQHNFWKKWMWDAVYVLIFSITFIWNCSEPKKNSVWYKFMLVLIWSASYFCLTSNKLEYGNSTIESWVILCEQTDFMNLLVTFCNFVTRPKNMELGTISRLLAKADMVYSWLSTSTVQQFDHQGMHNSCKAF